MKIIALKVGAEQLERWKMRAGEAGLTLSGWVRLRCDGVETMERTAGARVAIDAEDRRPVVGEVPKVKHLATSSRYTCSCGSCVQWRVENGIPYGGFKKG